MKKVKFKHCLFHKGEKKGIYNKSEEGNSFPFDFFKVEPAREQYLINSGVRQVIQSWRYRGKEKILHTGIISIGDNLFIGNNLNKQGKKDFILLLNDNVHKVSHFFLVKNRNPINKIKFAQELLIEIRNQGYIF